MEWLLFELLNCKLCAANFVKTGFDEWADMHGAKEWANEPDQANAGVSKNFMQEGEQFVMQHVCETLEGSWFVAVQIQDELQEL